MFGEPIWFVGDILTCGTFWLRDAEAASVVTKREPIERVAGTRARSGSALGARIALANIASSCDVSGRRIDNEG